MRTALMKAYNEVYRFCWTQQEAWEKAVRQPAPRYYVSPKQAYLVLLPMARGERSHLDRMTPTKRRMYETLFSEVMDAAQTREFMGKSLWYICQYIVHRPAPEFFIDTESMRKTFRKLKSGQYTYSKNPTPAV